MAQGYSFASSSQVKLTNRRMHYWNGSAWVNPDQAYYWNGSAWTPILARIPPANTVLQGYIGGSMVYYYNRTGVYTVTIYPQGLILDAGYDLTEVMNSGRQVRVELSRYDGEGNTAGFNFRLGNYYTGAQIGAVTGHIFPWGGFSYTFPASQMVYSNIVWTGTNKGVNTGWQPRLNAGYKLVIL